MSKEYIPAPSKYIDIQLFPPKALTELQARELLRHFSGLPVHDGEGEVVGVVRNARLTHSGAIMANIVVEEETLREAVAKQYGTVSLASPVDMLNYPDRIDLVEDKSSED